MSWTTTCWSCKASAWQYKLHGNWLTKNLKLQSAIFAINMSDLFHWGTIRMERGTSYPYARNVQGSIKLLF